MSGYQKAYEVVTERIIDLLASGTVPWWKPWKTQRPANLVSKRPYSGVNVFLLNCSTFAAPWWLTFKQAKELGGYVKRGSKATPIILFKWCERERDNGNGEPEKYRYPLARTFRVFNIEQCGGIPAAHQITPINPIGAFETIWDGYKDKPTLQHGGDRAFYTPLRDLIQMPPRDSFRSAESYATTLAHEAIHSTGHKSRLDRKAVAGRVSRFGSADYSQEELVAECGAAMLANECGILDQEIEQSAAYIKGWLKALQNDKKLVVVAAAQAEKACNYILGRSHGKGSDDA